MPLVTVTKKGESLHLSQELILGDLNYSCQSRFSKPSINQPGIEGYVITGVLKWTTYARACKKINEVHEKLGFQKSHELSDAQVRILLSLCSSNFITVDRTHDAFKSIMLNMKTLGD